MGHSSSSSDDEADSSLEEEQRGRKRKHKHSKSNKKDKKKKHKKKKKKSHKKHSKRESSQQVDDPLALNYRLADAICSLLDYHPAMAEDLPGAILVQLASGTTLNLSTSHVRYHLSKVLRELIPYGVQHDGNDVYTFQAIGKRRDELVLVRVVRSLLDQIGITMEAIADYSVEREVPDETPATADVTADRELVEEKNVETKAIQLVRNFGTSTGLAKELISLCETILEGEVIDLEGLPDERLRLGLKSLFHDTCGMVPSEMDNDDEDEPPTTGLGMPDDEASANVVARRINVVREACSKQAERVTKGPLPKPMDEDSDDDEDDGPLLPGQTRRTYGVASAPAVPVVGSEGGREEWMLVPGKFDLLTGLKSGQPIRNRQFSGKRKDDGAPEPMVDPKIEEEIRNLREAHEASRGPSLMEEHRMRKQEEARQKKGKKVDWKWDRSSDLDAGRRVDKEALNMMLGGANTNLKGKFHSSL